MTAFKTKQALVPKLRFREFEEEWINKSMNDFTKINQGLQIPISERFDKKEDDNFFYITNEFLRKGSSKSYFIKNPSESVICYEDDILMTRTGNTGQVVTGVHGAFHNNFFKIKFDKTCSKWFLYFFLTSHKTQLTILKLAGTSTIPDLNHGDFYKIRLNIPTLPEQQKIASFLSAVDEKIQLLSRKKELLENYKKGAMQQLFSQKLRFKDAAGKDFPEWEEKRLGDVLDKTSTGLNPRDNFVLGSGNNNYVTIKNITNGRIDFSSCEKIDDIALSLIRKRSGLRKNDIIMSSIGNIGEAYLLEEDPLNWNINESVFMLRASINLLPIYLYYLVSNDYSKWYFESNSTGSSFKSIKLGALKLLPIGLPSKKEQQKIASFLTAIDEKIEAVNQQITHSQTFKKGLLQQMFV